MSNQGQMRANYKVHFSGCCQLNCYVNVVLVTLFSLYPSKGTLALRLHSSACCFSLSPPLPFQALAWIGSRLVLLICRLNPFLQIPTNQASGWLLEQPTKGVGHIKTQAARCSFPNQSTKWKLHHKWPFPPNNLPLPVGPLHSACISISCFWF